MEELIGRWICNLIIISRLIPYAIVGAIVGYLIANLKGMIIGAIVLVIIRYAVWRLLGMLIGWLIKLGNEK